MRLSDKFRQLAATTQVKVKSLIEVSIANARGMRASRVIPFTGLFFAVCAVGAVGVAPLAPDASNLPVKTVTQDLVLPSLDEQISKIVLQQQHYVKEEKIQRGDTLASLLQRLGVDDVNAANFLKTDPVARGVLQARAGKSIRVKTTDEGTLEWLRVGLDGNDNAAKTLLVSRRDQNGFQAAEVNEQLERRIEMRSGDIQSSLFVATDKALIPAAIADQIVKMFETSIDFRRLQRGDYFNVVYETFWLNGELVKTGRLLSGEFKNSGKLSQAVWFDEGAGEGGYYSFDGKSLKKAFLKSPLEFSRVSSGFSMRVHPISGKWKRHTGIDFAAATGTPIRASADGTIEHAGPQGGYGNMVIIKHWNGYSTAYAHMSRFAPGARKGTRVTQGQVIGYVGSTGWSTGPHLHYEFRVNNEPRDPNTISVQSAAALAAHELPKFRAVAAEMAHRFDLLRPERNSATLVAAR
ncbi:M23 family metallopeptidase [Undibacterium baiyunense]|uniref:M23 family metallopeptidase n=1 Tax=Undibacterium baiyunense TaxID=2828731 RepID=A0A941DEA2_9BURK|nr:M23 family metallopeptidase [Undibacterium baiyunense]MBR7747159.1 M23 family metallopeptidase [Undibacterium baiyunense]